MPLLVRIPMRFQYGSLLASLVGTLLVAVPMAKRYRGELTVSLFIFWVLLAGLLISGQKRATRTAALVLLAFSIVTELGMRVIGGAALSLFGSVLSVLVVLLTSGVILHRLFNSRRVTADTILGGICVYMLIGYVFYFFYNSVELLARGSFLDEDQLLEDMGAARHPIGRFHGLVYFSFVTLTTVGYGDVVPVGDLARVLAVFEALLGQVYLTTLVAILVGQHISQRGDANGHGHGPANGD